MRYCRALTLTFLLLASCAASAQSPPLLVTDITDAGPAQRLLAVSLQGIANQHPDGPRVFLLTGPRDQEWLDYCLRVSPRGTRSTSLDELLELLEPDLAGQILYHPDRPYTLDIATTAAGIHKAVISATDLGLPTVLDLRRRWQSAAEAYRWAIDSLLPDCSRTKLALLPPQAIATRDFAIQHRLFTISPPTSPHDEALGDLLFRLSPGAAIYGAAPPSLQPTFSRASHYFVPASQAANLSFFSRLDTQQRLYQYLGYLEPTAPRYLTFIFDCSDLDFAINAMPGLWDDPARGTLPLGWALPGALTEAAPPVLHRYYADAYRSGTDQFILGPSGAGQIDLGAARAPYSFFQSTTRAQDMLDISTVCYRSPSRGADLGSAVARLAAGTRARGVFLLDVADMPPLLYDGVPALAAPRVRTVADAINYLNNIPLNRRCVALSLDPLHLSPAEAAHIAAHVSDRYVVVPPEEMIELMRAIASPPQPGTPAARVTSVNYPESPAPDLSVPIKVTTEASADILSASIAYRPVNHPFLFWEPMSRTPDGFVADLPPLLCGGKIECRLRARDRAGRVAWLADWTFDLPRSDSDADGLTDAEERFLLTDADSPDSDADGLRDAADPSPLRPDHVFLTYLGPILPPSDLPYLPDDGGTIADSNGRHLQPGQSCLYWLPLHRLPPDAPAVIALDALGPADLAFGPDPASLSSQFTGELTDIWYSPILPPEAQFGGAFLRITCPGASAYPLVVRGLALLSPPAGPSIARLSRQPLHPGPEQPLTISALIFSPNQIARADLTYRVNDGGTIAFPMRPTNVSQLYQASIPALDDRDQLEWWITAADSAGNRAATALFFVPIGGRGRDTVSLLARRDFFGDWISAPDWNGAARLAPSPDLRDSAPANLTGGAYTVWVLAGPRGQRLSVHIGHTEVGSVDPHRPDGWHQLRRIRLEAGRHKVHVVSEPGPDAPAGAAPRYASVILTADSNFVPPTDRVLDIYNGITLLFPRADQTLSGTVELKATGAGNVSAADFSLDDKLLRQVAGPPFRLSLNTRRFANGPHTLRVESVDRAGTSGLAVEIPVIIAN